MLGRYVVKYRFNRSDPWEVYDKCANILDATEVAKRIILMGAFWKIKDTKTGKRLK